MTVLRIAHLAAALLRQNGEVGNLTVLRRRAAARNIEVTVTPVDSPDDWPSDPDLVFVGTGPVAAQLRAMPLLAELGEQLRAAADSGVPFLAIAAGFQALGTSVRFESGETVQGAGVFPVTTTVGGPRIVGDFVIDSPLGQLVGFENRGASINIGDARPLGRVVYGQGNTPTSRTEGFWEGSLIGTHLQGPVLANNPVLADWIMERALARHGETLPPAPASLATVDSYASSARAAIAAHPLSE